MIETAHLESGVTVLVDRVPHTRVACVGFWFCVGSRDEGPEEHGFAHFLEHMLFKGTERRTAAAIALDIDRVGGVLNAFTEKEVTCYHCTVPLESLDLALDVLSDMAIRPLLDEKEVAKERNVIVNEISAAEDIAEDVAHDLYVERAFGEHGVSHRITGSAREVREAAAPALRSFYERRYGARNLVVSVAGDIAPAEAFERVAAATAPLRRDGSVPPRELPELRKVWEYRPGRSEQLHFYAGVASSGALRLRDYYVSLVFSTLTGESMSSRLFQSLREDHALCYSIVSFRTQLSDAAMWTIYASTTPAEGARFLDMLARELARLKSAPPSQTEVDDSKSHLRGGMLLVQEDTETRMKRLARQLLMNGKALEFDESLRQIEAVTREDVLGAVEELVRGDRFSLLAYGGRRFGAFADARFDF